MKSGFSTFSEAARRPPPGNKTEAFHHPVDLLGFLGLLTALCFVGLLVSEFLDADQGWVSIARTGLFVVGIAWICLLAATALGQPGFLAIIPVAYLGAGGSWLYRAAKRHRKENQLKAAGNWRCANCRAWNDAKDAVCISCRAWRA